MSQTEDWYNSQSYLQAQMAMQSNALSNAYGLQNALAQQGLYQQPQQSQPVQPTKKKELSMFKEITSDVKGFVLEHRSIIYFLVFALLIDHLVFRGVFKARLESMANTLVTKVEEKIK